MDDIVRILRAELAGRYDVEHELGRGGMAIVYLARDVKHDRRVALKVLRQDIGLAGAGDRFLREIRLAAQLHHPHILPLYDSGAAREHLFYVMPYVEGETVRERLERTGPFSVEEAVRITREVADALAFAHERGIVHRDIKPDNIFLSAGHASVGDFGIARAADVAGLKLTETGMAVGTPSYMSPEQATADPMVDGRSDQYALGCVLYEMLAGVPPFSGPTSQAIMARHTTDQVPPLTTIRDVPVLLESAVRKALAKVPADRWPTTQAFATAIDNALPMRTSDMPVPARPSRAWTRIVPIAGVVVLAAALGWRYFNRGDAGAADVDASVGVLPFSYTGDTSYAVLANSVREDVITGLVRVQGLRVPDIGRRLVSRPMDDPREAGRTFGVGTVLTASITVVGNIVRVSPRLVNVSDGAIRWQGSFNGELTSPEDLFATQDAIVLQIVDALVPRLSPALRQRITRGVGTRNAEALRLFAKARILSRSDTRRDNAQRVDLLRRAVALDSNYADAWAELARGVDELGRLDGTPAIDAAPQLRQFLNRAIDLDSANANAYELRGRVQWFYDWNWEGAYKDMRHAIDIAPGSVSAISQYCWLLQFMSQGDSALAYARRLMVLDSTSADSWDNLASRYLFVGMVDSAIVAGEHAQRVDSNSASEVLTYAYLRAGRRADAARMVALWAPLVADDNPFALQMTALYHFVLGDVPRAREFASRLTALARKSPMSPGFLVGSRIVAGDREGAIRALEEASAMRERSMPLILAGVYPWLKGDPRVERVKQRVYGDRPMPRNELDFVKK